MSVDSLQCDYKDISHDSELDPLLLRALRESESSHPPCTILIVQGFLYHGEKWNESE